MQKKEIFPVTGLGCAACAARVNKVLNSCEGVEEANVNYASATALVSYDDSKCSPEALRKAVEEAGYGLITDVENEEEAAEAERLRQYRALRRQTAGAVIGALPVFVLSMFFMDLRWGQWVTFVLATVVVFVFGRRFFVNTVRQLRHGAVNMDTLVASSTGVAWLFSTFNLLFPEFWLSRGIEPHLYFEAASVIIAFILIGRLLEARAKQKTTGAIRGLMGLQPKTVTVLAEDGSGKEVPIQWARPGDTIIVRPGERVAVDGTVLSGESYVDESMLSGEPVPVLKQPESKVYAGTINQKGSFRFRADKTGGDTMLSQIIRMVQDAQGSKAPVQNLVDRVAAVFVPIIISIAVLVFAAWWIFAPQDGFIRTRLRRLVDIRASGRLYPRSPVHGDRADHRLSLRPRPGNAYGYHRGNRQGSQERNPDQGRRQPRGGPQGGYSGDGQDRHSHRGPSGGGGPVLGSGCRSPASGAFCTRGPLGASSGRGCGQCIEV